jgi:hypothetical protein
MKLARSISIAMTALGILLTVAGALLDLSPLVTITGMMLVVAGVVKIVMVAIWHSMFRLPPTGQPATAHIAGSRSSAGQPKEVSYEKLPRP